MCGGVEYLWKGEQRKVYFPRPNAQLPIRLKSGDLDLVTWGRRENEPGRLPATGWARLDSVQDGKWSRYHPMSVRIMVDRFMEKDMDGVAHWYDVKEGAFIRGLLTQIGDEMRVYVVTMPTPSEYAHVHNRWPRIRFDPRSKPLTTRGRRAGGTPFAGVTED